MYTNIFDRLSFLSLFLVVVLLPVFFLPFTKIPIEISKGLLLVMGLTLCIIFWAIARFFDGKISLPKSVCLLGGGGVVLIFFLSAFFSKASQVSFFGTAFDIGSFWFIFSAFLLMFCSSIIFRNSKQAKIVLFGAILSSAFVLIFQSIHLFFPKALSLGIFDVADKTANILGSWNALGLFAGFSGLLFLLVVEFFPISKTEKIILQIFILLSMLLVASINFLLVWILLGISSLIIFVYKASNTFKRNETGEGGEKTESDKKHFPAVSFVVVIISLLFLLNPLVPIIPGMSPDYLDNIIPTRLQISSNEISPSFSSTMVVTKSVLKEKPVLGIGPNKFGEAWASYKPSAVNKTVFWDVAFNSGSGLLPTLVSTTGYLGILAWLIFFVLLITSGVKFIFSSIKNSANWETMAFFVLSLYLFVSSFLYSTGPVIFLLAFVFTGVFIGLSASNSPNGEVSLSFLNDHRKSFFSMLSIILIIIISAATSFKYIERFVSFSYFRKAISSPTAPESLASINRALTLYSNDLYLRTYAQIYLLKFSSLISKGTSLSEAEKAELQVDLDQAVNGAQLATTYNPKNYLNFQVLGSIYQNFALFGVEDIYSKAIEAYKTASALNPLNPGLKLEIASSSLADGKIEEAKNYANLALSLKPDYVNTFIVLSQIAKKEGDNASALSYARTALSLSPTDKSLIQYVDSLKNEAIPNPVTPPSTTDKKKP